jgi:transposase
LSSPTFSTKRLDHLGIVAGICDHIDLIGTVNGLLTGPNREVSHGAALQAMVINALGFSSRPLYLSPEFFQNKPIDLLVQDGITAEMLNDDCLGRTLDACFEHGVTELFAAIAQKAIQRFEIEVPAAHLDTTSFSFHGEYNSENVDETAMLITYGYSKDHRPDLKQAVFALITAQKSSIPIWIEAIDGNHADSSSMPEVIEGFCSQLGDTPSPLLVMDAAFYSAKNIANHDHGGWLSRAPDSIKEVQQRYEQADEHEWIATGDDNYRYQEHTSSYGGVAQRWLLIHSQARQHRQEKTLAKRLARVAKEARKELAAISRRSFACEADVIAAAERMSGAWSLHTATFTTTSKPLYDKPGRPTKDAVPSGWAWKVKGEIAEDPVAVAAAEKKLGMYVIATNELDAEKQPSSELVTLYRSQGGAVERGFRFLKDPMFFADAVYLKKPERIMALMMVMTLALLVYSLAEKSLRDALVENNETLPNQTGKPTQRITMRRVFQVFEGIDILSIDIGQGSQRQILNFNELHGKIVNLLPMEIKSIYALSRRCGR